MVSSPYLNFNVGSDGQQVVLTATNPVSGGIINTSWAIMTEFDSKQRTAQLESTGIDGVPRFRDLEEGWEGTIGFDRGNSFLDDFIAAKEAARYAGLPPPRISAMQTINDPNGGPPSAYRYDGITIRLDDAGRYMGNAKVSQRVAYRASFKIKVQ